MDPQNALAAPISPQGRKAGVVSALALSPAKFLVATLLAAVLFVALCATPPRWACLILAGLTYLPLGMMAVFLLRGISLPHRLAVLGLTAAAAVFLFANPHHELFTGLDNSAYPLAAEALLDGRPYHAEDPVLATVPPEARRFFLFTARRDPTRDTVFLLDRDFADPGTPTTRPWFMPSLSLLAAAAARLGLPLTAPIALAGLFLLCIALAAAVRIGRLPALCLAAALFLATPLPAFFFRGFYAEAMGTALVAAAIAYALATLVQPPPTTACPKGATCRRALPRLPFLTAFLLVFPLVFHRSAALLGILFLFLLLALENSPKALVRLVLGACAGVLPAIWSVFFVAQPYGNNLLSRLNPALRLLAPILPVLALLLALLAHWRVLRAFVARHLRLAAMLLSGAYLLFWLVLPALPIPPGALHAGFLRSASALPLTTRIVFAVFLLLLPALTLAALRRRPDCPSANVPMPPSPSLVPYLFLLVPAFSALAAWLLLGTEIPAGSWSFRRLLPPLLLMPVLLPAALQAALPSRPRLLTHLLPVLLALPLVVQPFLVPYAYAARIHPEAPAYRDALAAAARATQRPVLFDYFREAIPLSTRLANRVLSVHPWAYNRWGTAISVFQKHVVPAFSLASPDAPPPVLATCYLPVTYEQNALLVPETTVTNTLASPHGNRFLSVTPRQNPRTVTFLAMKPLRVQADFALLGTPPPSQRKTFDGGPAGLRGAWGPVILRHNGEWARQNASMLGPVPPPGGMATLTLQSSWYEPDRPQPVTITTPWGATQTLLASTTNETLVYRFPAGLDDIDPAATPAIGAYHLSTPTPYAPGAQYPTNLVLFLHTALLSVE